MSSGRIAVVLALGVSAVRGLHGRRNLEVDERCTQVQPGAPRDDGRAVRADELVDGFVCEQGELACGHGLREVTDSDEPGRLRRLVRENREAAIDLERICRDDLRAEAAREGMCHGGLAGCRRAEDRNDLDAQSGDFSWGTPAHHPLRA